MKNSLTHLVTVFGLLLFIAIGCENNRDDNTVSKRESPSVDTTERPLDTIELENEFLKDPRSTREKYTGKQIVLRGVVKEIFKWQVHHGIILKESVYCNGGPYVISNVQDYDATIKGIDDLHAGDGVTLTGIFNYQSYDRVRLADCKIVAVTSRAGTEQQSSTPDETKIEVRAHDLLDEYKQSPAAALRKYKEGKLVVVRGSIYFTQEMRVMLKGGVSCIFNESHKRSVSDLEEDQGVTLSGTSSGIRYSTTRLGTSRTPYLELKECEVISP